MENVVCSQTLEIQFPTYYALENDIFTPAKNQQQKTALLV